MYYDGLDRKELESRLKAERERLENFRAKKLDLDMTRGKPCGEQLKLSEPMLDFRYVGSGISDSGTDCRNYGLAAGIPEARKLMGDLLGVPASNVICGGNSSLNMMYDTLATFMLYGVSDSESDVPWSAVGNRKFICPVPGYDRHFAITEQMGFTLVPVDINPDGPDVDAIEKIASSDDSVKGIWGVPKYSNPTGYVFSNECIKRLASMKCAASDFRIFWDDAYTVHFLKDEPAEQLNLMDACAAAGNPERAVLFGSTSKITFPGAGIAALAAGDNTYKFLLSRIMKQTIGPDKLNQLRHVRFLSDKAGVVEHMKRHAAIIKPKFEAVIDIFRKEFGSPGNGILRWTEPEGGYFICARTQNGSAKKVVAACSDCGVRLTPAGSTHPYGIDPTDSYIRLAPSFPDVDQIRAAVEIFSICVKIDALEKLLAG